MRPQAAGKTLNGAATAPAGFFPRFATDPKQQQRAQNLLADKQAGLRRPPLRSGSGTGLRP